MAIHTTVKDLGKSFEKLKNMEVLNSNSEVIHIVETSGLEKTKSQRLLEMFTPYFNRMGEIEVKINGLNSTDPQKEDIKIAREIRLALKNNRVASEKIKDDAKASILIEGRLIDNLNNIVKNTSKGLELKCEQIEKDAEIKEAARIEAVRISRVELLAPYVEDANIFPLGSMTQDQFDTMLSGYKLAVEQKKEAEAKAEAERLAKEAAEKLEQERIRQENETLKAEAEEKEKALAAERAENERLAKIEAEKQAAILKEAQEKADKERAENEAKLKAAAAEAEKLQRELKAKQDAEKAEAARLAKIEADRVLAEKKAAKAPDKEKLKSFVSAIQLPAIPELKTEDSNRILSELRSKFTAYINWALQQIESI